MSTPWVSPYLVAARTYMIQFPGAALRLEGPELKTHMTPSVALGRSGSWRICLLEASPLNTSWSELSPCSALSFMRIASAYILAPAEGAAPAGAGAGRIREAVA